MIVVLDFGSQVAHLICRRIRELNVYSELVPFDTPPKMIEDMNPCGIILSGGPNSVYEKNTPIPDIALYELGIPMLGICYGHQLLAKYLGGLVSRGKGEYGQTIMNVNKASEFLNKLEEREAVWMSHSDFVERVPDGFTATSYSENNFISSMEDNERKIFGVQFHPEVSHTPKGKQILKNFIKIAGCLKDWRLENFITNKINSIKKEVGNSKVLMGISGGIDSSVAAEIIHRAIGDNLYCIFVDNGLLREGEFEEVCSYYEKMGLNFCSVNAAELFLSRLTGVVDPEEKRKIIGNAFIEVFEEEGKELGSFSFLGQGTIYPDRVESAQTSAQASTIKTHHNVGGLPEVMKLALLEPLKDLYKDEVRRVGSILNLPEQLVKRHPFPGPGLAVRIVGEIIPERLRILRESDDILKEELENEGVYNDLWQVFTAFLDIKTVGVMGDARSYQNPLVIRCVDSIDAMTANSSIIKIEILKKIASRIVNEVDGVNRVFYDLTDKPPATIEYE